MDEIETPKTCANCHAVSPSAGGRPSASGLHYCMKPKCQAARQRARRAALRTETGEPDVPAAPCANCGTNLPARAARVTDNPHARWCSRGPCQRARRGFLHLLELNDLVGLEQEFVRCANLGNVGCEGCGTQRAVRNFAHPSPTMVPCTYLSKIAPIGARVFVQWPELVGS